MRKSLEIEGLIAATFTPMNEDGSLSLDKIEPIVEHLLREKIAGLYICGSTGEGPSLTLEERKIIAEAYMYAAGGRLPIIVQVGHDSLVEAGKLAEHAQKIEATAIAAAPPGYYEIKSVELLLECLVKISYAAPDLPLFYYHVPQISGVNLDMVELLRKAGYFLPDLAGIIYCGLWLHEFQACLEFQGGRFTLLFGRDEMLISGLSAGARAIVGSTLNFAAPLYNRLISAFRAGNLDEARRWQSLSVAMVRLLNRYRGESAVKGVMKLIGLDCGPNRLPLETLNPKELDSLKRKLEDAGFFQWARK